MSELAQRIIASHKAAAKRAVFHLGKTRKLRMSATESLELVACVLGVANWQTLLAMANEGRGPRIDDGTLAPAALAPAPAAAEEKSAAERLADYYGTPALWGAHPKYTREDWARETEDGNTGASYWNYVVSEIESWGDMYPWERDNSFAVKLARLAGMDVEPTHPDDEETGWTLSDPHGLSFFSTQDYESELWAIASDDVMKHLIRVFHLSQIVFDNMSERAWLTAATSYFGEGPKVPVSERNCTPWYDNLEGRMMFPGEMNKSSRESSGRVKFCRAVGIEALFSDAKADEGKFWVAAFEFYASEAEAWATVYEVVRNAVLTSVGITIQDWDQLAFDNQVHMALKHSALAATFKPAAVK